MRLTLNIDHMGDLLYMETPDGQKLPNVMKCELPKTYPHNHNESGWPAVTVSFSLHDIDIRMIDIRALARLEATEPQPLTMEGARAIAQQLARQWWGQQKLSYNWNPSSDVEDLAAAIYNQAMPS